MPEISHNALMMSVQAIHQMAKQLSAERETITGPEQATYDDAIEAYEITAMELQSVYEEASKHSDLPPYASLVR